MKRLKINLNRTQTALLLVNGILVLACIILTGVGNKKASALYSQQAAVRWQNGETAYAQVSAFFSPDKNVQQDEISGIRSSLMGTLLADSLNSTEGDGRVWIDAYSGECNAELRRETNILSVTAVGVGGDYFQFHPIPLLSGSYISDEDLNHDRIVVDEYFAWAMFGSNDIVGMSLWMGDETFVIAGVVAVEDDELYRTAYGANNRIYMSYDQLKRHQESLQVTCYEAVMPNPISNYAYYALRSACGIGEETTVNKAKDQMNFDDVEVIENSNRYEVIPLLTKARKLRLRSMRTNSVGYPYWENMARVTEETLIWLLTIRILLLISPCVCVILWISRLWKTKTWTVKGIFLDLAERIRKKYEIEPMEESDSEEGELRVVTEKNIFKE